MAHHNTVFSQILKLVPRHEFESLARAHHTGRAFRSASRWSQFVAMSLAQLAGRCSLRDIVDNLGAQAHRLYHLGSAQLARTTLARLNDDKPYALYEALFGKLLHRCQAQAPAHGFRFHNRLYSLDASTIDVCLSLFPWAKFRSTKGAVKLHVGLNHAGHLPEFVAISDGKTSDIELGRSLSFPEGSVVVMDRGYTDYSWYNQLNENGIFFVTRLKSNARYRVVARRSVLKNKGLICDQTIEFTGRQTAGKCPIRLRRIGYRDPQTGQRYVFVTNRFDLAAKTIADIYKARWQVELFFKSIKQNLKIKTFVGTSKNAVMTQIWIAMCVYLLLAFLKFQSQSGQTIQQILRVLQLNLFEKRELMALLRGDPPPNHAPPNPNQLALV
jgi:putative transposase